MGSKVIGFRLPGDMAEELEKESQNRGITPSDFLRGLVDEALYPIRKEQPTTLDKEYIERSIGELESKQRQLIINIGTLTNRNDQLAKQVKILEQHKAATPGEISQFTSIVDKVKSDATILEDKIAKKFASTDRKLKRVPTDQVETWEGHDYRVYKSTDGLVKPKRISLDPLFGNKYIDLADPLN